MFMVYSVHNFLVCSDDEAPATWKVLAIRQLNENPLTELSYDHLDVIRIRTA